MCDFFENDKSTTTTSLPNPMGWLRDIIGLYNRIMSNSDMDVLDLLADKDFSLEEVILTMDQQKESGYIPNMNCPVPDCNVPGAFPSRAKYRRHWEETHVPEVQK